MTSTFTGSQRILLNALARAVGATPEEIEIDADVFDLGLDSLDFWTVLADVEHEAGSNVPAAVLDGLAEQDDHVTVERILRVVAEWEVVGKDDDPDY